MKNTITLTMFLCIAFIESIINAAAAPTGTSNQRTQYIVRKTVKVDPKSPTYNHRVIELRKEILSGSKQKRKNLQKRFAIMAYINERIIFCFAQTIAKKMKKVDANAVIRNLKLENTADYISLEYERNVKTEKKEFTEFTNVIDTNKLQKLIDELVPCNLFDEVLTVQPPTPNVTEPPFLIKPDAPGNPVLTRVNQYLSTIETALQIIFSKKSIAEKSKETEMLKKEMNTLDWDKDLKAFIIDKITNFYAPPKTISVDALYGLAISLRSLKA